MLEYFKRFPWVLEPFVYEDPESPTGGSDGIGHPPRRGEGEGADRTLMIWW